MGGPTRWRRHGIIKCKKFKGTRYVAPWKGGGDRMIVYFFSI